MPHAEIAVRNDNMEFADLASLPKHRFFRNHPLIDRSRRAVTFNNVTISGLDLCNFDYASFRSVDSDMPPSFIYTYYEEALFRDDPMVADAATTDGVLVEEDVYREHPPTERLAYVLQCHNIRNRTVFPLKRDCLVYGAVEFTRQAPFSEEEIIYLKMLSEPLHLAFTKPIMDRFGAETMKLTTAEIDCLRLASHGMTTEEIAEKTGYQRNTVNTYFQLSSKKLGAANRSQAIAEAIRRQLIE